MMTLHQKTVLAKRTHLTLPLNKNERHWSPVSPSLYHSADGIIPESRGLKAAAQGDSFCVCTCRALHLAASRAQDG